MDPLSFLFHLLGFVAPAFAVALLVAGAGWLLPGAGGRPRWWWSVGGNFALGVVILAGGVLLYDRDGKMATYAALVVGVATNQWLVGRGWRG